MTALKALALFAMFGVLPLTDARSQALKDFGSFHVGGRQVTLTGYPVTESVFTAGAAPTRVDPNGDFEVEQMYVQYLIPANQAAKYPLLMWHGGGLTGVTWETKPDGKPGWMQYFFKAGHPSTSRMPSSAAAPPGLATRKSTRRHPSSARRRRPGRSSASGLTNSYATEPSKRVALQGQRFPTEAFDQFAKQFVPRWTSNDAITQEAYHALVQKVGNAVLMFHSQAGNFGFQAALKAPEKVKGLIAIEPAGAPPPGPELDKLKGIPVLIVWGDFVDKNAVWTRQQPASRKFADDLKARGGDVEWIELPKVGIAGNTHMMMMDTNSDQIADLVQDWMKRKGLMN